MLTIQNYRHFVLIEQSGSTHVKSAHLETLRGRRYKKQKKNGFVDKTGLSYIFQWTGKIPSTPVYPPGCNGHFPDPILFLGLPNSQIDFYFPQNTINNRDSRAMEAWAGRMCTHL